jgi:O-antigen/teichoic acid export membrane protein
LSDETTTTGQETDIETAASARGAVPARVWTGTALQVLGRVWSAVATLAILYLAAREIDPEGFGRFTFYIAMFAWLDSLAMLGTGQVAVQRTAAHPDRVGPVLAAARAIRVRAALVGVALTAAIAFGAREPDAPWIVLASLYPLTHVLELSTTVFKNRISWRVPVLVRSVASALSLAFVALLAANDAARPALYLAAVALGSTIGNVLLHLTARAHLPRGPHARERGVFREALPLGIAQLCMQGYFYADNLFVRPICGEADLGRYNVAVRLMSWTIMVAQYASLSVLPWFTRRHRAGDLSRAVGSIGPALFALAGLGCGAAWPWTREILELFREGFGAASASLRWLLLAAFAVYAGSILVTAVVALGKNRALLAIAAGGLALNVAANAWAVPALGIQGAGLTTFATEAFVALAAAFVLARSGVRAGPAWRWLGGPLAFAAAALASSGVRALG